VWFNYDAGKDTVYRRNEEKTLKRVEKKSHIEQLDVEVGTH